MKPIVLLSVLFSFTAKVNIAEKALVAKVFEVLMDAELSRKLDEIASFIKSVSSVEWANAEYIHTRFGINHMSLRALAKGGEVRVKKLADGENILISKVTNTVYRVSDVEEWLNRRAVIPDWVTKAV